MTESRVSRNPCISFVALKIWSRETTGRNAHSLAFMQCWKMHYWFLPQVLFFLRFPPLLPSFYLQRPQIKWLLRLINWSGECRTLADSPWPSSHLPSFNSLEYFLDCSKAKCLGSGAFDSWNNNNKRCLFFKGLSHQVLFTQWEDFTEIRNLNHLMFFCLTPILWKS